MRTIRTVLVFLRNSLKKEDNYLQEELKKIDYLISNINRNNNFIKNLLTSNPDSIFQEEWLNNIKTANNVLENPKSIDELKNISKKLENLRNLNYELNISIDQASNIINQLKNYLKNNLASELAPKVVNQVKYLEQAIKSEDTSSILIANKEAEMFILKEITEPEEKKIEEEKKLADEKEKKAKKNAKKMTCTYNLPKGTQTIKWIHYSNKVKFKDLLLEIGDHYKEPENDDPLIMGQFEAKLYKDKEFLVFAATTVAKGHGMTIYGPSFVEYRLDFFKKKSTVLDPMFGVTYKGYCQ